MITQEASRFKGDTMPDTTEFADGPWKSDRRLHPRQPVSFSCMQLPSDNGGKILNISESGLAMQAVRSLADGQNLEMRFQFSRSQKWIETRGRIVWISASRRTAGVKFLGLPDEARDRIRKWIALTAHSNRRLDDALIGGPGQLKDATTGCEPVSRASVPECEATARVVENPRRHLIPEDLGMFLPGAEPISRSLAAKGAKRAVPATVVLVWAFAVGLAIGIGILSIQSLPYTGKTHELLIDLAESISDHFRPRPVAEVPASMPSFGRQSVPSAGNAPSDKPKTDSLAGPFSGSDAKSPSPGVSHSRVRRKTEMALVPGSAKRDAGDSIEPQSVEAVSHREDHGQAELESARRYLRESNTPGYGPAAAHLLWLAIEKGNTAAEVQLADLYLRGEVVPMNCNQARILLRAAHNANDSAVALPKDDCK